MVILWIKRSARIAGWTGIALFIVFSCTCLFLMSGAGKEWIKSRMEHYLSETLDCTVRIGSLDIDWFHAFTFTDISLRTDQVQEGTGHNWASLNTLHINWQPSSLLSREVHIESILCDSLRINLGESDLQELPGYQLFENLGSTTAKEQSSWQVNLDTIILTHAEVHSQGEIVPVSGSVYGIEINAQQSNGEQYAFDVTMDSANLVFDDIHWPLEAVHCSGMAALDEVSVDTLILQMPGAILTCNGSINTGVTPVSLDIYYTVELCSDSLLTLPCFQVWNINPPFSGDLTISGQANGAVDGLNYNTHLHSPAFVVQEIPLRNIDLNVSGDLEQIMLSRSALDVFGGTMTLHASVRLDSSLTHQASVSVSGIDLPRVYEQFGIEALIETGSITAMIESEGMLSDPMNSELDFSLALGGLRYQQHSLDSLSILGHYAAGHGRLQFEHGQTRFSAAGPIGTDTLDITFEIDSPDIEELANIIGEQDVHGEINASGRLSGVPDRPVVEAQLNGRDIHFQGFPVDQVALELSTDGVWFELSSLEAAGYLDDISLLSSFYEESHLSSGELAYEINLCGTKNDLNGTTRIGIQDAIWQEWTVNNTFADISLNGNQVIIEECLIDLDTVYVEIEGGLNLETEDAVIMLEAHPVTSVLANATRQTVRRVIHPAGSSQDYGFTIEPWDIGNDEVRESYGAIHLDAERDSNHVITLHGSLQDFSIGKISTTLGLTTEICGNAEAELEVILGHELLSATGDICITRPGYGEFSADSIRTTFSFDSTNHIRSTALLFLAENNITANAQFIVPENGAGGFVNTLPESLYADVSFEDFDLSHLTAFFSDSSTVRGRITSNLRFSSIDNRFHLTGFTRINGGEVRLDRNPHTIHDIELELTCDDTLVHIDSLNFIAAGQSVHFTGDVRYSALHEFWLDSRVSVSNIPTLSVSGFWSGSRQAASIRTDSMDIAWMQPFLPEIRLLDGTLQGRISFEIDETRSSYNGNLGVSDLIIEHEQFPMRFSGGEIAVRMADNRILLDTVSVRCNETGYLGVNAAITLQNRSVSDLFVTAYASNLEYRQEGKFSARVNEANLQLQDEGDGFLLSGAIRTGDTRYVESIRLGQFLSALQRPRPQPGEVPTVLERTRIQLDLQSTQPVWIDNNLARLKMQVNLHLVGTAASPTPTGRIAVSEGYVFYLDRRFDVRTGVLDFLSLTDPYPIVDLIAVTEVIPYGGESEGRYSVTLELHGPANAVRIDMYSSPYLDQPDIVSLLTLGTTRGQLSGEGGEGVSLTSALAERAEQLASRQVSSYVTRRFGTALGLEQTSIEGNLFDFSSNWGPQLLARKRFGERVEVTYTTRIGRINDQGVILGYHLTPRWLLEGQTDQRGNSTLDIKYRVLRR